MYIGVMPYLFTPDYTTNIQQLSIMSNIFNINVDIN